VVSSSVFHYINLSQEFSHKGARLTQGRCEANAFTRSGGLISHEALLLAVGGYFSNDRVFDSDGKVVMTDKPPIYFQHQGHSMTIIGLEVRNSGAVNLVVFDPMFNPSPAIKRLVGSNSFRTQNPERLLKAHRRGESYLGRYRAFEILK
jgi:zinc finger-containing ubiquitin peptidase 1